VELVCTNGAVVYDAERGEAVHRVPVDPAPAVHALADRLPGAAFAAERHERGFVVTDGFRPGFTVGAEEVVDLATLVAEPTVRVVCTWRGGDHARMAAAAAATLDPARYGWELGYSAWLDVMAPGVSKATGVALLCEDLGVDPADVLAVGDGTNDLALFGWAGWAVAMGQSPDAVRDAADEVAEPVERDGAAAVLDRWFR
jgi:hypothetical protein